ncbi:hypothetical protein EOL73_02395 [Candidatus Saccharibacteria bacterium]|nr:hypothetical protein [Candidatus Saccharibacteria bacterium]
MKKVLIIVSQKPENLEGFNWFGLTDGAEQRLRDAQVSVTALSELTYITGNKITAIYDNDQGFDISDFDLVVFRTVGDWFEWGVSAAHYLKQKGVKFIDEYLLTEARGKLACSFARQAVVPVPTAVYTRGSKNMDEAIQRAEFTFPLVLKADIAKKGDDNFLIESRQEFEEKLSSLGDKAMIAQEYIPNDGDYRLLTLNGKVKLAFLRQAALGAYLNNTSKGGSAHMVDLSDLSKQMVKDAETAADLERLQVAGVDLVINKLTGKHYILEVNRAPQVATGAFNDKKMDAYAAGIQELLDNIHESE